MNLKALIFGIVAALGLTAGVSVSAQSTNPVNPRDFSAFQIVSERNIFDPNRQPRVRTRTTPRVPKIVDSFSLVGTMSYSNVLLAFFDGTSSDYRKSLEPGGKIANYTATEIGQDVVKLVSGTNEIDLKVGMQMRRSADGNWAAAAASETSFASNHRNEVRGGDRGSRRFGSYGSQASSGNSDSESMQLPGPGSAPDQPPPDLSNLDPNDPVARLMLRRLQAEGGVPPAAAPANTSNGEPENAEPAPENSETNAHENVETNNPRTLSTEQDENRN
ncbi:MAG TPA: hypothetical protein VFW05_14235 [Verrucomicrobiae bacterium]|jgi:hypothetical protein|nr:hypothetical protein [Verrucomicrobiae bacterium]